VDDRYWTRNLVLVIWLFCLVSGPTSYCRRPKLWCRVKRKFPVNILGRREKQDVGSSDGPKSESQCQGSRCGRLKFRPTESRGRSVQISPVSILPTRDGKPRKADATDDRSGEWPSLLIIGSNKSAAFAT